MAAPVRVIGLRTRPALSATAPKSSAGGAGSSACACGTGGAENGGGGAVTGAGAAAQTLNVWAAPESAAHVTSAPSAACAAALAKSPRIDSGSTSPRLPLRGLNAPSVVAVTR